MIVAITSKCNSVCTHCMSSCDENGVNMDDKMVDQLIKFLEVVEPSYVGITGGEPTEHPSFERIVNRISRHLPKTALSLLSNGLFILDEKKTESIKRLLELQNLIGLQITYGSPFYPRSDEIKKLLHVFKLLPKTMIFDIKERVSNEGLFPAGRAVTNWNEIINDKRKPGCINLYLMARQVKVRTFGLFMNFLQLYSTNNFCKPLIDPLGNVRAGEPLTQCKIIGNIFNDPDLILNELRNKKPCNKCNLLKNLPEKAVKLLEN